MATVYQLIDTVLTKFGTGYCPHCRRIGWCQLLWNAEQERFDPTCLPGQLGITREHYYALLEQSEDDEDSETPEAEEEPMIKGQLVRTLIGLMLIAALYSFGFTWWGAHDPGIGETFMVWVATPVVNLVAIGMAWLQIHFYKQGSRHFFLPFSPLSKRKYMHEMKNKHHRGEIVQDARAGPSFSRINLFLLLVE